MQRTILIVDDSELDRQILATMASKLGFAALLCHDGQEALSLLNSQNNTAIDLMLLDLHMEKVDGISTLGHCKVHHPDLPVIIITSSEDPDDESQTQKWGADGFIRKPVTVEKLEVAVARALHPGDSESYQASRSTL